MFVPFYKSSELKLETRTIKFFSFKNHSQETFDFVRVLDFNSSRYLTLKHDLYRIMLALEHLIIIKEFNDFNAVNYNLTEIIKF